jgi:hypothetical protein
MPYYYDDQTIARGVFESQENGMVKFTDYENMELPKGVRPKIRTGFDPIPEKKRKKRTFKNK